MTSSENKTLALRAAGGVMAIGAAICLGLAGVSASYAQTPAPKTVVKGEFQGGMFRFAETDGQGLYTRVCAGCHMPDAKGAQGSGHYPALVSNEKLAASGYPVYIVTHGRNGMPGVGRLMTDQQVADVVNYVRTHFGNSYTDAVTAADVKAQR